MSAFDLTKTEDSTMSVVLNYLPIGLSEIFRDDANNFITANCALSPSSNVTYTNNNVTTEYKANKMWIVGKANDTKLNVISGIEQDAQLIVRNMNSNGDKILFVCFPLIVKNPGPPKGAIDSIIRATLDNVSQATVSLNDDIFRNQSGGTKFVEYTSNLGNNATVLVYGRAIEIISVNVLTLQNNLNLFNLQPENYNIITAPEPGEWMECDYVPLDSQEVASYNLPVSSGIVQDSASNNALKTMLMFVLFIFLVVIAFSLIPITYIFLLKLTFSMFEKKAPNEQTNTMTRFNQAFIIIFGLVAAYLIYIGVFGNPLTYPNYAQYLLYGMVLAVILIVCYIIIQAKRAFSKNWPINEIQDAERNE